MKSPVPGHARPFRRRLGSLAAAVALVAGLVGTVGGGSPASAATIGAVQIVPEAYHLFGVACPTTTTCVAVGDAPFFGLPVVVVITNGVAGSVQFADSNAYDLRDVACPTATTCYAVGGSNIEPDYPAALVPITITDGSAVVGSTLAVPAPSFELVGIACSTATACVAVGQAIDPTTLEYVGAVVPIVNGTPGATQLLPSDVFSVACATDTTCYAVSEEGVVPVVNGVAGTPQVVQPSTPSGLIYPWGIACATATTCYGVGRERNPAPDGSALDEGAVVTITNGIPGTVQLVPGTAALESIGCASATTCVAGGNLLEPFPTTGQLVEITNGVAGAAQPVADTYTFYDIACRTATACVAVGITLTPPNANAGVVVDITGLGDGTTTTTSPVTTSTLPTSTTSTSTTTTVPTAGVTGSAYGYFARIGLFGGSPATKGPTPTVTLPADGSEVPVTAAAETGAFSLGPALFFSSGPITVSTQGSSEGPVTSSADITTVNTTGQEVLTASAMSSTCTASGWSGTVSTTITGGVLQVDGGKDINEDGDFTDEGEHPPEFVDLPSDPDPNTTYLGHVHVGSTVTDEFRYVFNEQTVTASSTTVNAGHMYLLGSAARGDLIIGQSVCGATGATGTSTTSSTVPTSSTTTSSSVPPTGFTCGGRAATLVGSPGPDRLTGTDGSDVIAGLGGDDRIDGLEGDDLICAGGGSDNIIGGAGNDTIDGAAGDDRVVGSSGRDELRGSVGNDTIVGGSGNDVLRGGPGIDSCNGGSGTNTFGGCETKIAGPVMGSPASFSSAPTVRPAQA